MKTLVIISALVACCTANPGWINPVVGHSLIGGPGLLGAPSWLGARTLVSGAVSPYGYATGAIAAPGLISGPSVIAARTYAAPSLVSQPLFTRTIAAPSLLSAPAVVASRTIAAPIVASAPAVVASRTIAAPIVASAPAVVASRTIAAPIVASAPAVVASRTIAAPIVASAPAVVATRTIAAPIVAAAPVVAAPQVVAAAPAVTKSQWHSQTELGQASYGHTEPLQTHTAVQDAHGNKVGSFSYLNPHDGQIHRTDYIADAAGYRVAANDLPADTPDVAIAKAAHAAAHLRARRSLGYLASPYGIINTPLAAPVAVAAPIAHLSNLHEATLTTIVNNPGHAVSYRVD